MADSSTQTLHYTTINTLSPNTSVVINPPILIHPLLFDIILAFNHIICGEIIGLFGIVSNIINIIVFVKQGFDETVNITLTSLAISNIGALVSLQLYNIMANPWMTKAELSFLPIDIAAYAAFYPHNYFIRVGGFITAFASLERCMCVVLPLTFKNIITKKVVITANVVIFLATSFNIFPAYYVGELSNVFSAKLNKTVIGLSFRSAILTAAAIVRGLGIRGTYFQLALVLYSFAFLMETLNSSVNVFVYYNMSGRYRTSLMDLFQSSKGFTKKESRFEG
ncbi:uncharacterized protein LOC131943397 [Physella acuta]|uniref:uncharacterized protein LOC131943397 n=1 Tax=Physella acuta TaxID=109671 RepID=UPI0027DE71F8|nr:uncharacterized protein LOC131943397 [Physella acuta]